MPPPPTLIDPNMISDKAGKDEGDDEDEAMDGPEDGESKSKPEVRRPEGGEVKWWSNVIEIQPTGPRDARYNWIGVNGRSPWSTMSASAYVQMGPAGYYGMTRLIHDKLFGRLQGYLI